MSATANDEVPRTAKDRSGAVRDTPFSPDLTGQVVIGVDPGSRYTAVVARDGDVVLYAGTIVRVGNEEPISYARKVVAALRPVVAMFPNAIIGVEGITDPKGFKHGQRAALNPKDIVRTGVVAGAVACAFEDAVVIRPGNNGSKHLSHYPASLQGRRPADLPGSSVGAGTRRHEQSAFDIAEKALTLTVEGE